MSDEPPPACVRCQKSDLMVQLRGHFFCDRCHCWHKCGVVYANDIPALKKAKLLPEQQKKAEEKE